MFFILDTEVLKLFSTFSKFRFPWKDENIEHGRLLLECIFYLSALSQAELPYHIRSVLSNDKIYACSSEFADSLVEMSEVVMGRLEDVYRQNPHQSSALCIELLETCINMGCVESVCLPSAIFETFFMLLVAFIII